MKVKNLILFFSLTLVCGNLSLFSQNNLELGGFLGVGIYQGDVSEQHIEYEYSRLSSGVHLRYNFGYRYAVRANYVKGNIAGNDLGSQNRQDREWKFTGVINEVALIGEVYLFDKGGTIYDRSLKSFFNPYAFLGFGYANVKANLTVPEEDASKFPEAGNKNDFLVVPFGIGVKGKISKVTTLGFEFGYRATFSDYIDNVSVNGQQDKKDWYSFLGINLNILFDREI